MRDAFEITIDEDKLVLERCSVCKRFRIGGKWKRLKPRQAVKEVFKRASSLKHLRASLWTIAQVEPMLSRAKLPKQCEAVIHIYTRGDVREARIPIACVNTQCPDCARAQSKYYEGTIQLRNVDDAIIREARRLVQKAGARIQEEKMDKRGSWVDWKVTRNEAAIRVVNELARKHLGEVKITSSLYSRDRQTSKEKKRVTALFRKLPHRIGDIILYEDKAWRITRREQGSLVLRPVLGGKERKVLLREAERFTTPRVEEGTLIRVTPRVEVLDDAYETLRMANQPRMAKPGERVTFIRLEEENILLEEEASKKEKHTTRRKGKE